MYSYYQSLSKPFKIKITENNVVREIIEPLFDFGLINDAEIREQVIEIENTLNESVYIYDTETTCGCSTLLIDNPVIEANSIAIMKLTVNPKKREGENVQQVQFKLDKGNIAHVKIHVKSHIKLPFYYSPEVLQMDSNPHQPITTEIRIKMNYDEIFTVSSISTPQGYTLSCKVGDTFEGESKILLTRAPSKYETDDPKNIIINGTKDQTIQVTVIEQKPKYFLVNPSHIAFVMGSKKEVKKNIQIKTIPDADVPIDLQTVNISSTIEPVKVHVIDHKGLTPVKSSIDTLTVELTTHSDLIQSSTFGFIFIESGFYQQSIPIWINKIK